MTINEQPPMSEQQQPEIVITKSGDYTSIYSNWVQTSLTPFDISLIFGEALAVGVGKFEVEQKARIILSPKEAKIVAEMLLGALNTYEAIGNADPSKAVVATDTSSSPREKK